MKPRSTSPISIDARARTPELEDLIRRRAYDFYEQRGREQGHEVDDWLQAEAELTGKSTAAAAH